MRKYIPTVAVLAMAMGITAAGVALAQVAAASSTYILDIDPARYNGPPGQRLAVVLDDQPRHITLTAQDEICVQLKRAAADGSTISAHVRVLRPEPHAAVEVKVAGPGISPGTFRSTPWGMLVRMVPPKAATIDLIKPVAVGDAPVCSL